jgi:uncharacterized protein (TIGR00290 family)
MNGAALFSGGKDSLYALYLAEKQGFKVDYLITLLPTFSRPSPHAENINALKLLASNMEKHLTIVDFRIENALIEALKTLQVDTLIAGDINVEAHLLGLKKVCEKVGLDLFEPVYGRDTFELFNEIFSLGFSALITGVDLNHLGEEWLGFVINQKTGSDFLSKIGDVDPLGENGEFHTLVLECPLFKKSFSVLNSKKSVKGNIAYLNVTID